MGTPEVKWFFAGALLTLMIFQLSTFTIRHTHFRLRNTDAVHVESLTKPKDFPIIGIVFYGRREYVDVLDCYLKKNLVSNGGYLDEVRFMARTKNAEDIAWVEDLVDHQAEYSLVQVNASSTYGNIYQEHLLEQNAIYIKIDDDILFMSDNAVPDLVHSLLAHPEAYAMSAYLINNSRTNWLAYHTGAIHPFLPDKEANGSNRTTTWRHSALPEYPSNDTYPGVFLNTAPSENRNHRWLPLSNTAENMAQTPMSYSDWSEYGMAWTYWALAAQQHYSFFKNYEEDGLGRYLVGHPRTGIFNMRNERYSINFFAIWGKTISLAPIGCSEAVDEIDITVTNPQALAMPFLVDSKAIVSHFAYTSQKDGLRSTDLLDRYRALANEVACPSDQQKQYFPTERDP